MEDVELVLVLVQLHAVDGLFQLCSLVLNHFFSFLDFLLLFLKLFDLLIDLLFHHLEQVLVLDFELVHDTSEGLLQFVNLFVELFADLNLELVV